MTEKLKKIKLFLSDVDGVMTDARIWLDPNNNWRRSFSVYDGIGLKRLQERNIKVGIITAANAEDVRERFNFLKVDYFFENTKDKLEVLKQILDKENIAKDHVSYIGDDLMDLPVIEAVGFGVTVPHALDEIKEKSDYVTFREGGFGAVRELSELIIKGVEGQ